MVSLENCSADDAKDGIPESSEGEGTLESLPSCRPALLGCLVGLISLSSVVSELLPGYWRALRCSLTRLMGVTPETHLRNEILLRYCWAPLSVVAFKALPGCCKNSFTGRKRFKFNGIILKMI